ncbi:MAG: hypothetical protein ACR2GN_09440 [Bacteroidia bacterium]
MKNLYKYLLIVLTVVFIASCAKEDDPINGVSDARSKYVGTWTAQETSSVFGTSTYSITISTSNSNNEDILLKNFYNLGAGTVTIGTVNIDGGGNSIQIKQQQISGNTISGSGTYGSGKITFNFTSNDGQTVDNVTVSATKN